MPAPLEDGVRYVRYDPDQPAALAAQLAYYLANERERLEIASRGCSVVREHFTMAGAQRRILYAATS